MDWLFSGKNSSYYRPETVSELIRFVSRRKGPFSIAGEQYSSGGQTLTSKGWIISLKSLPEILKLSPCRTKYWVGSGMTWYQVLKYLVPFGKVPLAMQSYYSFSVGGSLSVNAHGRNGKRLSDACLKLEVLLMDGQIVRCSPQKNSDLYFSVIGGYGCIAIILQAKLLCIDNIPIFCRVFTTSNRISSISKVLKTEPLLYNAELNIEGQLVHICWYPKLNHACDCDLSEARKISEPASSVGHVLTRFGQTLMEIFPPNVQTYQNYRWQQLDKKSCYLSFEMAEDASKLKPLTQSKLVQSLLQEYFVPFSKLPQFQKYLENLLSQYSFIQLINLSIRVCQSETNGGYLDWLESTPSERVCVVLYLSVIDNLIQDVWESYHEFTHSLILKSCQLGGTWYLPYVPEWTKTDLDRGYPSFSKFQAAKKKYDPEEKLNSYFWQRCR